MDAILRAWSQGTRQLARRPLTAIVSALCLGVGIAACGASWALADAVILRPFGLSRASELVVLWETDPARGHDLIEILTELSRLAARIADGLVHGGVRLVAVAGARAARQ